MIVAADRLAHAHVVADLIAPVAREELGRPSKGILGFAAGVVERKAEQKAESLSYFRHRGTPHFRSDEV